MSKTKTNTAKAAKKASIAVSKRWAARQTSTCSTKTEATQTDHRKDDKYLSSEAAEDISSVQAIVDFVRNIPDLMESLPVPVSSEEESLASETMTHQIVDILDHYNHDLGKATSKKLQLFEANLCLTSSHLLVAALCLSFVKIAVAMKD